MDSYGVDSLEGGVFYHMFEVKVGISGGKRQQSVISEP